jgi:1A family penicillin-binding protein
MDYKSRRSRLQQRKIKKTFNVSKLLTYNRLSKYALYALIAGIVLVPLMFLWFSRDLPTPGKLIASQRKDATRIYDRNGEMLYSVYQDENRTYVKLSEMPKKLQQATISIEDKDFYKNSGFSPIAYVRVVFNAALGKGLAGGSTISQQLVKNVLLTNERSVPRKIKELILAIQINRKYKKDDILEMYLNNISYGGTAVGVEAASQQYFNKKAKDINLAESAFLAGLPQSPSRYAPFAGGKLYVARTEAVLKQMVENKYITKTDAKKALEQIKNYKFSDRNEAIKAPHFVMYVREILSEQFGEQAVTTGGLQVTTSLDYDIQEKAEEIVKKEIDKLKSYKVGNGAAVVTDPKTGEILSMVGSKDYFDRENEGNFNVASSNTRQPGSSLKPIMYAVAFEKGYTPSTLVMDTKTEFPGSGGQPTYIPVNYDGRFRGPSQIRFALGNSLNIPAVKMLAKVGIDSVMKKGYEMGIENWEPTAKNRAGVGLSLVLGGRETSLLDQMTAYGVFANKGVRQDPVSILKVTDANGKVLYERKKTSGKRVLSEEVAFLISHILLDNNARSQAFGSRSFLNIPGKTVSVKTGTTDDKRDNWTFGYTPSYAVGVWVGNNDNTPMNAAIASGITGASPIWNKIMVEVLKDKPDEQPQKPENVIALLIDNFAGGLPHGAQPTRSEYFVKGTEPASESPIYKSKDGQEYYVFKEDDPISTDGVNRWQKGIDEWIQQFHKDNKMYHPPDEVRNQNQESKKEEPTPTSQVQGAAATPTPTPTPNP